MILNIRVDTARDLVLKLHKTANQMIENAKVTEKIIVYGNKFRSTSTLVDDGLRKSEKLFYKGDYEKALEIAVNTLESIDPEFKDKVINNYAKS